ncbi:Serine/threonine-protein kinase TOS3 [Symbiodinium microadriaticum]|uniref:Serine/threonine-protein kinase TOS3 n=1 Tax=Symbiodinium microadriaticum TaxID=2951 RepID=A0A1Q9EZX5_SYMMI|nr:Serine/threonine-protein kinase TOS3 [Symbiodinium microadriaticum]
MFDLLVSFIQASTRSEGGRQSFRLSYRMTPELLGKGSFGKVCKAVSSSSGEARAVKVVELLKAADGDLDEKRLAEARVEEHMMLRVGRHEHVVELLESFADLSSKRFYFVMEMCSCSIMDASEFVLTCDDQVFSKLMTDVARALAHIHKRGVVHRDVKPENLLFADSSKSSLKLCDFGLAAVAPKGELLPGRYGTLPFMSPEMAAASGHTFSTDLWSLGATLYLLIFGDYPYRPPKMSREHVKLAIVTGCVTPTYQRRSEATQPRLTLRVSYVVVASQKTFRSWSSACEYALKEGLEAAPYWGDFFLVDGTPKVQVPRADGQQEEAASAAGGELAQDVAPATASMVQDLVPPTSTGAGDQLVQEWRSWKKHRRPGQRDREEIRAPQLRTIEGLQRQLDHVSEEFAELKADFKEVTKENGQLRDQLKDATHDLKIQKEIKQALDKQELLQVVIKDKKNLIDRVRELEKALEDRLPHKEIHWLKKRAQRADELEALHGLKSPPVEPAKTEQPYQRKAVGVPWKSPGVSTPSKPVEHVQPKQERTAAVPQEPEPDKKSKKGKKDLVRELLARDRKNRPTAQQILRHEFCAKDTKIIGHVVSVATDKLKAALQVRIGFSAFACWRAQKEDDEDELGEPKRTVKKILFTNLLPKALKGHTITPRLLAQPPCKEQVKDDTVFRWEEHAQESSVF